MPDPIGTSTRRPGPFGPAWALLPKGQEVLSVSHDTQAWDAIDRMMDSGFSQLPVTRDGRIIGVFTWRSFGKRVADLRRSSLKAIDLPVSDCVEPPNFIDPETFIDTATDWSDIDYVLVGTDTKLIGILCVADVFGRLNDFAEAFVLLYELENDIRDLITAIVGDTGLAPLVTNMRLSEKSRPLRAVTDFTFDQYRGLICCRENWPTFEKAFISIREVIDEDFKQVTELRNTVFHFRRGITPRDTDRLRRFRDSLRYGRELQCRSPAPTVTVTADQEGPAS